MSDRVVYRDSGVQIALGLFIITGVTIYSTMVVGETGEHPSAWWALLLPLPVVVLAALPLRSKLVITGTRVVVVNPFKTVEVDRHSVIDVSAASTGVYGLQVVLHCDDGTSIPVTALQCGWGKACRRLIDLADSLRSTLTSPVERG